MRAIKGVAAGIADGAQKRYLEGIVIEIFGVARVGQAGIRDLVWTCRPTSDSVVHGVAEAGVVVGDAERRSGIPNENPVHLPAGQGYLLHTCERLPERQFIIGGRDKSMAEVQVAAAGLKPL